MYIVISAAYDASINLPNVHIAAKSLVAIVDDIMARIPYGVSLKTNVTIAMTSAYIASIPRFKRLPFCGCLRATRKYAKPTNVAKITTAIVEVVL